MKKQLIYMLILSTISLTACNQGPPAAGTVETTEPPVTEAAVQETTEPVTEAVTEAVIVQLLPEEAAAQYLADSVPEIAAYNKMVTEYSLANNTPGNKPILRIDQLPDDTSTDELLKNYFSIYIGEITDTHTNRWNTFYVRADLQEVLVEDIVNGGTMTLEQWREQNRQ